MRKPWFVVVILLVMLGFVACNSGPRVSNIEVDELANRVFVSFNYSGDTDGNVDIVISDKDGVRMKRTVSLRDIRSDEKHRFTIVFDKDEMGYGFYHTGTIAIIIKKGDKKYQAYSTISLPVKVPEDFSIVSAYIQDSYYVVRIRAKTSDGEDAVLGKGLKIYIGDMSGRQLYLRTFDVFKRMGQYQVKIPVSQMKKSYTRDVVIKAKLIDYNESDYVQRRAIVYEPISKLSVSSSGSIGRFNVHICPMVREKKVPVVGKIHVSITDGDYKLFSKTLNVSYKDFDGGCYVYYLPEEVKYSPTGKADIHITLEYEKGKISSNAHLSGLKVAEIPDDVKILFDKDQSGVDIKVCAYKQSQKINYIGKVILSIYDGKHQIFKDTFEVDGKPCISKYFSYKTLGPTSGGKAKVYVTLQPKFGKSLKSSSTLSGLMVKIYKVGYYYAGKLTARMKVVVSDAKFIRDKYDKQKYYFGIYVTITNIGSEAAYVWAHDFDAIDSLGDILDSDYVGVSGEYDGGNIYPGYSRRGWMFFKIPDGVDITKVRYVKIGFRNIWDEWNTLVTIPVYEYMFPSSDAYTGT